MISNNSLKDQKYLIIRFGFKFASFFVGNPNLEDK